MNYRPALMPIAVAGACLVSACGESAETGENTDPAMETETPVINEPSEIQDMPPPAEPVAPETSESVPSRLDETMEPSTTHDPTDPAADEMVADPDGTDGPQ